MKSTTFSLLLTTAMVSAQTVTPSAAINVPVAPTALTYTNLDLHLTFTYPDSLLPEDAKAAAERGHIAIYGNDPDADPEHAKSEACDKVLLAVSKESDPKKRQLALSSDGGKEAAGITPDPGGSIILFDVDQNCIPKKARKNVENTLAGITLLSVKIPGMKMIDKPIWYELQKQKVHLAIAQGRPIAQASKLQADDPVLMAVFAVHLNEHILCWMIMSNDMNLFNTLLKGKVDFGTGTPQPLFPMKIGTGSSCVTGPDFTC